MIIPAAVLALTVVLSDTAIPLGPASWYEREPVPTKASRAALMVDTSRADRTVVIMPSQANCDRIHQWAEQVSDLLVRTGRADTELIVEGEPRRWLPIRRHGRLADELRRQIHQNLAAEEAADRPAPVAGI